MAHIAVIFCTDKKDWISAFIRFITWSRFSHVGLASPDGRSVIESTHGIGVREVSAESFLQREGAEIRFIDVEDAQAVWERAISQIGKPYDWKFSYGWLSRRNWQDDSAWACSELIAWAARCLPPDTAIGSVSPRDLYLISKPEEL